jgi:hypothetical protein
MSAITVFKVRFHILIPDSLVFFQGQTDNQPERQQSGRLFYTDIPWRL